MVARENGTHEITIDISQLTARDFIEVATSETKEAAFMTKVFGISEDEYWALPFQQSVDLQMKMRELIKEQEESVVPIDGLYFHYDLISTRQATHFLESMEIQLDTLAAVFKRGPEDWGNMTVADHWLDLPFHDFQRARQMVIGWLKDVSKNLNGK